MSGARGGREVRATCSGKTIQPAPDLPCNDPLVLPVPLHWLRAEAVNSGAFRILRRVHLGNRDRLKGRCHLALLRGPAQQKVAGAPGQELLAVEGVLWCLEYWSNRRNEFRYTSR